MVKASTELPPDFGPAVAPESTVLGVEEAIVSRVVKTVMDFVGVAIVKLRINVLNSGVFEGVSIDITGVVPRGIRVVGRWIQIVPDHRMFSA